MRGLLAVCLGIALTSTTAAQDSVPLKWKLNEGTGFYAKNVTDMDMKMSFMGQDIDINMKITAVQKFKVISAKPKETKVELTMLQMNMEMGGVPGGIPGLGDIGNRLKGITITATLDENFTVKKVDGYDKFAEKIAGDDENLQKMLKQQFSEATVGQFFSQVFAFAPEKPVKVGDTWDRSDKMQAGGFDATVKQKFKLAEVNDGIAKIGLTMDMDFKAGDSLPGLPEGVKLDKFDMKAEKFGGTLLFDTKAGRVSENTYEGLMNGEMTISAGGNKVDMTMKIKMKQSTAVTDKNPIKD
jgi:hypothetical protein